MDRLELEVSGPKKDSQEVLQNQNKQNGKNNQIYPRDQDQQGPKKDQQQQQPSVSCCELFRFATCCDYILMFFGSIGAIAVGAAMPAFAYIWGLTTDSFNADQIVDASRQTMYYFFYLGTGIFFAGLLMYGCWMIAGQRQAVACRKAYLRALLKQQIGWFDLINQTQLASKFSADTINFQYGVGEKVGTLIMPIATLISGFIFAFITGWLMTLVCLAVLPALAISGGIYVYILSHNKENQEKTYSKAGGRAQQALSSIKTIKQLNGQEFQTQLYKACLTQTHDNIVSSAFKASSGIASVFFVLLASYALGFWYGSKCVIGAHNCPVSITVNRYTAGNVLVVFFSVLMAGFNLTNVGPSLQKIAMGRMAAARIFKILDREPQIKNSPNAKKLDKIIGKINFENVTFSYPKEKDRIILDKINLQFDIKKSALVGQSGSGKSTIFQLILRFYDPNQGRITLDGVDIKQLDLRWLRQSIGYVGQQPVLFATTIKQNMLFAKDDASDQQIKQALRKAEAYDFVYQLQDKIDTFVGMGGGQLSGGQKQRIAIARALLRDPQIMLFDEATSALDRRNERLIQDTLEQVASQKTSITIAHRVRTIMNCDIIYVLNKGKVEESGRFGDLKKYKGQKIQQQQQMVQHKQKQKTQVSQNKNDQDHKLTKEELQKKQQQQVLKQYQDSIFMRLFSYTSDKCCLFILGIFFALGNGTVWPLFSLFFAKMLNILLSLYITPNDSEQIARADFYALMFLVLAIGQFVFGLGQMACFAIIGQNITYRLRMQVFQKILKMPVPWFDIPRNNSGSLAARLFTQCNQVNGLTTMAIGIMIQNISAILTGLIIGFVFDWRTSLVALGMFPLLMIAGLLEMQFNTGENQATDEAYKDSASLIMESMINIRTVTSSGYDQIIVKTYEKKLEQPQAILYRKGIITGLIFGFSQLITYFIMGILFFIGAVFVNRHPETSVQDMFTALYALVFAAFSAGNNAHFMPDAAAANNAAANLFKILDSEDQQQMQVRQSSKMLTQGVNGDIQIQNISFKYQSRNEEVFKNLSMTIKNGTKVAFVGTSGCGKSTIMQMLQRFYDPTEGKIIINGNDIKDYDIKYLRRNFGVVSQQPVLFNGTFKQNIIYNSQNISDDQMIDAAKKAAALPFIMNQQKIAIEDQQAGKGFERNVGVRGSHISGGQKQRVAIARAILRNPNILLLDEATSALDSINEKIVQQSLDLIMAEKTSISIAHRIETIKNSDKIYVFVKGIIQEQGKYNELVSKRGYFYNLQRGTQFI